MAGTQVHVLVSPTSDLGKILTCMHGLQIGGEMKLGTGIQVAELALKNRRNKKLQQRIIVFVGRSKSLRYLPGVDPTDPQVKDLLASMQNQSENKEEQKARKEEEKK